MFHKGLNKEIIIDAAKELIEKDGIQKFSMHKLADKLGVKTALLYTHIKSMEYLFTEVGPDALNDQKKCLFSAIKEKHSDDAIKAIAKSYRQFATEHIELYHFIMQMPSGNDEVLKEAASMTAEPFMKVIISHWIVS